MPAVLDELAERARLAVIRLRSLGDCVLTTPAIRLLKDTRPDLEIAVVVEPRFAPVFEGNPDVSAILEPEVKAIRGFRPQACINLHGGSRSLLLTVAPNPLFRIGFSHYRWSGLYNIRVPQAQRILGVSRKVHTAEHLASAMFYIGAAKADVPRARLFAPPTTRTGSYAVLHPFAAMPEKTWPAERFVLVARELREQRIHPVIIGGAADNFRPFHDFEVLIDASLTAVKTLMQGATLFVGNDSGPAHIAAAFGIPVIVIFGPSDSVVWAPWRTEGHVLTGLDGDITAIRVDQVMDAVERVRVTR